MSGRAVADDDQIQEAIRSTLEPLTASSVDERFATILDQIGNAKIVMLGSASYGTRQFQRARAEISRLLLKKKDFTAVAIEADWADAHPVQHYVQGKSDDADAEAALAGFQHFPQWMWRNHEMAEFVEWLRTENDRRSAEDSIAFYGLDLYGYDGSLQMIMDYLKRVDRKAAQEACYRYSCFEQFDQDPEQHGYAVGYGLTRHREEELVEQLATRSRQIVDRLNEESTTEEDQVYTAQVERLIDKAGAYYRAIFRGRNNGWNLRERHLFDSLRMLIDRLGAGQRQPKIIVWTHNSHLGDARFTEMSTRGEMNLGQLIKESYANRACTIGFTNYSGTVAAASTWGGQVEFKQMRPALPESYEALFHSLGEAAFSLNLHAPAVREDLRKARLERAVGAVYRPQTERISHYFYTQLSQQFDLVLHFNQTDAVVPLGTATT